MPLIFLLVFLFSIAIAPAAFAENGDFGNISQDNIGTAENPYLIDDEADLKEFRSIVNNGTKTGAHAKLTKDITLTSSWTPIGGNYEYTGTFDGNGCTITGLYINSSSNGYSGLFSYIGSGGTVMNLKLESVNININDSASWVGAVAGRSYGAIEGCTVTGSIYVYNTFTGLYVGGIAGDIMSTSITNCINSANVYVETSASSSYVGGIVGYVTSSTLINCGYLKNGDVNSSITNAVGNNGGTRTNVGTFSDADELNNIVFKLTPLIGGEELDESTTYSMAADGTMEISFDAWPGNFADAYSKEGVEIPSPSDNDDNDLVSFENSNGTITVIGKGSTGEVEITVTTKLYTYEFSTSGENGSYTSSDPTEETYTVKVNLVAAETPGDEETGDEETGTPGDEETGDEESGDDNGDDSGSTESGGASGGSSGGGCNAGTGALALLALIPLALRKKR